MKHNSKQRSWRLPVLVLALLQFTLAGAARADWANVKNFGATGNGVTDDAPAIRTAIGTLTNGGTLYFPAGQYMLCSTQSDSTGGQWNSDYYLKVTNGLTIEGDGMDNTVLIQSNYLATAITFGFYDSKAGVTIKNLKLQADVTSTNANNSPDYTGSLLIFHGYSTSVQARGIHLENIATDDQARCPVIYFVGADDVHIDHCRFTTFTYTNNLADPGLSGGGLIMFAGGGFSSGAVFLTDNYYNGNVVDSSTNDAGTGGLLYMQGANSAVISGNYLVNFKQEALQIGGVHETLTDNVFSTVKIDTIAFRESLENDGVNTNFQIVAADNVESGGATFFDDTGTQPGVNATCIVADNTVQLGSKPLGTPSGSAIGTDTNICQLLIEGNSFDYYGSRAISVNGNGNYDSSLLIQGNSMTSLNAGSGGYGEGCNLNNGGLGSYFQNISFLDNTLSGGGNADLVVNCPTATTNVLGNLVVADNLYLDQTNQVNQGANWIRVVDSLGGVPIYFGANNIGSGAIGADDVAGYDFNYIVYP